jgi:hypothetical protein
MKEDSGKLTFTDDIVSYESRSRCSWRLDAAAIRLVGEFTNQSGPYMDDYFFVFFKRGEEEWYEASFYCDGRDEAWKALTARFSGLAQPGLFNSADSKSRVLWPAEHAGQPLFEFREMKRGSRWQDRLLDRLFSPFVFETILRPEYREKPNQSPGPTAPSGRGSS